jgi:hypothetical protein
MQNAHGQGLKKKRRKRRPQITIEKIKPTRLTQG